MEQSKIPTIPKEQPKPIVIQTESKLWIASLICIGLSLLLILLSTWLGFIPAIIATALAIVASILAWKDFDHSKKMIALLCAGICCAIIGIYAFGSSLHGALYQFGSYLNTYDTYDDDEWYPLDEYNDRFDHDHYWEEIWD